jgi:hypothetical protein
VTRRIDLVARTSSLDSFRRLLRSLENQASAGAGVGVVAALDGVEEPEARRFASLAAHHTDLVVTSDSSDWWGSAAAASDAEFLLPVVDGEVLTAGAVDLLLGAAAAGSDLLVARAATPGAASDWDLFGSPAEPDEDLLRAAAGGLPVLVRRSLVTASAPPATPPGAVEDVRRGLVGSTAAVLLAGHPVLRRPKPATGPEDQPPESLWAVGRWVDGALHLELAPDAEHPVRHVTLRHLDSGVDWLLETQQVPAGLLARLAPCAVADGEPLTRGRWVLDAHLATGEVRPVAWRQSPGNALLSGLLVVAARGKRQRVVLDVGATRRSPLADLTADAAAIEESARGTLLRWPLPLSHVVGDGTWPAGLDLGGFPVMARISSSGDTAHLEAWLSGLKSRVPVSMELAGSPAYATGFDLEIGATGLMALLPHEDDTDETGPGPGSGRDRAESGGFRSLVRRVRRGSSRSA